MVKRSHFGLVV